jgi:hypothetical protein
MLNAGIMCGPIDFNGQTCRETKEVENVRPDRMLAAKA